MDPLDYLAHRLDYPRHTVVSFGSGYQHRLPAYCNSTLMLAPVLTGDFLALGSSVHTHRAVQFCGASSLQGTSSHILARESPLTQGLAPIREVSDDVLLKMLAVVSPFF